MRLSGSRESSNVIDLRTQPSQEAFPYLGPDGQSAPPLEGERGTVSNDEAKDPGPELMPRPLVQHDHQRGSHRSQGEDVLADLSRILQNFAADAQPSATGGQGSLDIKS